MALIQCYLLWQQLTWHQTGIATTSLAFSTFQNNLQDCHFNVLRSTLSLSSIPSGTHHLQQRWLWWVWLSVPALDNISSCHRSAHVDTTRPPSFLSLWPHHLEQST